MKVRLSILLVITGCLALAVPPARADQPARSNRIVFAGYRSGQWDIYTVAPDGSDPRQLTADAYEDTDPAYAPDGTKIAFASRRNNNWDVYVLDLLTGQETRLTNSPEYDGAPTWRPNGAGLAFESYRAGDLDIWYKALDNGWATNLTATSPAGDFAPAWSPDDQMLAFTSWRNGTCDLYLLNLTTGLARQLTSLAGAEEWATWDPAGKRLAFVIDELGDRELFTLDLPAWDEEVGQPQPLTWLGRTDGPAWSPTGEAVAAIFHHWSGDILTVQPVGQAHRLPRELTGLITVQGRLDWHAHVVNAGETVPTLADTGVSPLYEEGLTPNDGPGVEPYNLVKIDNLNVTTPWLADTVNDSFVAWRFRLRDEVGYDFLSHLSDAARPVTQRSDTTQYTSWHKSGRAVDTLFDYYVDDLLFEEIVREDYSGETYWRIFLRCMDQTGRCGRPLVANPWNYSDHARTEAPEQGGYPKSNLSGYYVDMTAMAREYGWQRISSYNDKEYSWTWHFLAFEYWHYQKRLTSSPANEANGAASNWYQAMREVYPASTIDEHFTWDELRRREEPPYMIALKGMPLPLEVQPWWRLVRP